ncbi:snare associated Golgi protein-domain-containing protein [Radiomyces spectabilis]|uniref:snare associated Golgi protein-domain-containing protein n=1 Tax=Radiomyces spectabilis TaxID=64574 RepID=UPI0022204C04|nr:snare associated Golgi protein-domain-containing protein [Radiomyces spectabilis]KAI8372819.1 snare associated Golgi protein-domain-containing protein [Radiomyces spectabilis]
MTHPNDTTSLLQSPQAAESIHTYATIEQHTEESGHVTRTAVIKQRWLWQSRSYVWSLATLILLFVVFTSLEFVILKFNLPDINPDDRDAIKFPRSFKELTRLNQVLSVYIDTHFINVYTTFFITYIYLQSFSIPGSMWLSILGGALFNFWLALFTVSLCSAIGAAVAYAISGSLASVAVMRLIGHRIAKWQEQLVRHRQHMFNYIIVLRIAPFPPNWTVNLGAPHLAVPIGAFFWGTFFGVAAPSFIHVQAGAALDRLSSSDELKLLTPTNILCLVAVAVVALIPVLVRRRYSIVK